DVHFNIAFTHRGLERLGCPPAILSGFSDEFICGLRTPHRARILGDSGANSPERWEWGNAAAPVDAALLLYALTATDLTACYNSLRAQFGAHGIDEIKKIDTDRKHGDDREHFGFHDGITNPTIAGLKGRAIRTSSAPVKAGEFILGYENEYRRITARPVVDRAFDPQHLLKADVEGSGGADFGRNGSYL